MAFSPTTLSALIYLFNCSMGGFVTIFLPIFFDQVGITEFQIGIIAAVTPIVAMMGAPLWGALADTYPESRKKIMVGLSFSSLLALSGIIPVGLLVHNPNAQFGYTLLITCVAKFASGSIGSLLDAIVVEQVPKNAYGRLRLWCAIGYGGAAGVVGIAMNYVKTSKEITWLPYVTHFAPGLACSFVAMSLMMLMPSKKKKKEDDETSTFSVQNETSKLTIQRQTEDETEKAENKEPQGFFHLLGQVPKTIDMFLFVCVILLCGGCMGLVATFLFIFIQNDLHGSQLVMGLSVLVTCAAEVPIFYFSEHVLNRIRADWTLVVSLFAYVVRFGLYWFLAAYKLNAWCILLPEVMHGFTFALMWCSAVAKATETISGLSLTNFAVGFITAVLICGNALGSLAAGAMLRQGVSMLWVWQGSTYMMAFWTVVWTAKSVVEWCRSKNSEPKEDKERE